MCTREVAKAKSRPGVDPVDRLQIKVKVTSVHHREQRDTGSAALLTGR